MKHFFVDESLHPRGGFVVVAFVHADRDPAAEVREALSEAGLKPGIEEFKSGAHVGRDPRQAVARDLLYGVLTHDCRIALLVAPSEARPVLCDETLLALRQFADANRLAGEPHVAYFDQGILESNGARPQTGTATWPPPHWRVVSGADSRTVLGLQLADLVAHAASIMLLEELGVSVKLVKAGSDSGYDSDLDLGLGFEIWAGLRWRFFGGSVPPPDTWKSQLDHAYDVEPYGLYVSQLCAPELAAHARARFGKMYLGCIH